MFFLDGELLNVLLKELLFVALPTLCFFWSRVDGELLNVLLKELLFVAFSFCTDGCVL